jgi:hypothetical protein
VYEATSTLLSAQILSKECEPSADCMYVTKPLSSVVRTHPSMQSTMRHLFAIFRALHASDAARPFVASPYCVLSPMGRQISSAPSAAVARSTRASSTSLARASPASLINAASGAAAASDSDTSARLEQLLGEAMLVFDNLVRLGFHIGLPEKADIPAWLAAVQAALAAVRGAGVIHLDTYLSNIMWKRDGDSFAIKLIDWDASFWVDRPLPEGICRNRAPDSKFIRVVARLGGNADFAYSQYHDVLPRVIGHLLETNESGLLEGLRDRNPGTMNGAFREAVELFLCHPGA